jgi:hypothetical protein
MMADKEAYKSMGFACCRPWFGRNHAMPRLGIGIFLVLIGFRWFGSRMGWIDLAPFHPGLFWPVVVILIGVWLCYRGLRQR